MKVALLALLLAGCSNMPGYFGVRPWTDESPRVADAKQSTHLRQ